MLRVATYDTPAFNKTSWPDKTQLAWPILGVRHFSDINRNLLLEAGAALNLAKGTAERLLENQRSRIEKAAGTLYAEVETENEQIVNQHPELAATMAGESRCLRTILHTAIKEMTGKIA